MAFRRRPLDGFPRRVSLRRVVSRLDRLGLRPRGSSSSRGLPGWGSSSQEARHRVMLVVMGMVALTATPTMEVEEDTVVAETTMEAGTTTKAVVGGAVGTRETTRMVIARRGMIAVGDAEGEGITAAVEATVVVDTEEAGMMGGGRREVVECSSSGYHVAGESSVCDVR
jgi:hypothetical protein